VNILQRARIELAVQLFEYHLESRGTRGARRRDLRRELRANLVDAANAEGVAAALEGIGSPLALAVEVGELDRSRPRWWLGALWGAVAFALVLAGIAWTNAVMLATLAASGGGAAAIEIAPWWGIRFTASVGADGTPVSIGAEGSLIWLLAPLAIFLLASQPWRPWTHPDRSRVAGPAGAPAQP
jgi:hypothetical protein